MAKNAAPPPRRRPPGHPDALTDGNSVVMAVRVPHDLADRVDQERGDLSRSEFIRRALERNT